MVRLRRLNIAYLYQDSSIRFYEPQAAQLHIYHTMRGLQQAGHEVKLLALRGRQILYTNDLHIFSSDNLHDGHYGQLGFSGTALFKRFESLIRRIQSELSFPYLALFDSYRVAEAANRNLKGIDLIHERFNLLALGGVWASRKLGIPLVLEVNADLLEQRKYKGVPERGLRRQFAIWATRMTFKSAAKIICVSDGLRDHLRSTWNVKENKLIVLPCAADVQSFGANHNFELIRRSLGLTAEPVVIWVGGFYPWHDLDLLINSFAQVLQKLPNARLILVGDGKTRPMVERKVLDEGLGHAVIMTGAIAHHRVPEILSIADLAVVPSAPVIASRGGTGAPLKLFEYMAAGKPIVATAIDQTTEVIRDGHTGILVNAGSVSDFADAILTLLCDSAERSRLGQNARQQAIEQYSWEQYSRRLEEIYLSIMEINSSDSEQVRSSEAVGV